MKRPSTLALCLLFSLALCTGVLAMSKTRIQGERFFRPARGLRCGIAALFQAGSDTAGWKKIQPYLGDWASRTTKAEGLNNAIFVPATDEEVVSLLNEGTGALLIGAVEDTATRAVAEVIIAPAEEAKLDRIYHIERCPESCIKRLAEYAARRSTSFASATGDEALLVEAAAGEPHGLLVFVNHGVLAGMQAAPSLEVSNPDQEIDAFIKNIKTYLTLIAFSPCPGHC